MRRFLAMLGGLLLSMSAIAAVQISERVRINLVKSGTTIGTYASWDACRAEALRQANASTATSGSATYICQTERRDVIAAYSPNPLPPVDCAVSPWSDWSGGAWSACVDGSQSRQESRSRTIVTQPANGGAACPALTETRIATQACTPPPVDCVVSEWSAWSGGAWSACSAAGQQTRQESRSRSIVTPPAFGGAACPVLTESRTASQACTPPPVDPPPGASGFTAQPGYVVSLDSGSLDEGGVITIKKAAGGFGSKSPAKPFFWAPMDSSMSPSPLGVTPAWFPGSTGSMAYAAGCGAGGGGCAQGGASNGSSTNNWTGAVGSPAAFDWNSYGQKAYVFRKSKRDFDYTGSKNVKIVRVWNQSAGGSIAGPNMYFATSNGRYGIEGVPTPYQDYTMGSANLAAAKGPVNDWYSEELLFKSNSNSATADADFRLMVNGGPELVSFPNTSWMTHTLKFKADSGSQGDGRMRILFAVHMLVEGSDGWIPAPAGSRYWADDVYVDSSWARVMVTDSANCGQSRHREIQIPREPWIDTSISVQLHKGEAASLSGKYLCWWDPNNVGSNVGRFD